MKLALYFRESVDATYGTVVWISGTRYTAALYELIGALLAAHPNGPQLDVYREGTLDFEHMLGNERHAHVEGG